MNISKQLQWYKDEKKSKKSEKNTFIDDYEFLSKTFGKSATLNNKKAESHTNSTEKRKKQWIQNNNYPITPQEALLHFSHYLTKHEKNQIKEYKDIYYLGHKIKKREVPITLQGPNYDTQEKQYKYTIGDHIVYRYELIEFLGKGSYGQVLKVYDHKKKEYQALKIIRNKKKITKQAYVEISILLAIKQNDKEGISGIVRIKDFVEFRKHVCILFELLNQNLYDIIKANQYNGLDIELIRRFAIQILNSLKFLKENRIIHCDLKPENILLKQSNKSGIKIIDFGSSCFQNQILYSYIQSRYYRAPEITFNIKYNYMIDMWSLGCILIELYLGSPIFPGENQFEQISYMIKTLGVPPVKLLDSATRKNVFFNQDMSFTEELTQAKVIPGFGYPLKQLIQEQDHLFLEFIQGILRWQPQKRLTPQQALKSQWILEGLPEEVRNVHKLFNEEIKEKKYYPPPPKILSKQKKMSQEKNKEKSRQKEMILIESKSKSSKNGSKQAVLKIKQIIKSTVEQNSNNNNNSNPIPRKKKLNLSLKLKSLRADITHDINLKLQQNSKNEKQLDK